MKICRDCGNIFDGGTLCPECGGILNEMSEREQNDYNLRLKRAISEGASHSYGLFSTVSDRIFGSLSLFCMAVLGFLIITNAGGAFAILGILFLLGAAILFLAPKLVWNISSIRLRLMTDEKDPQPSALWVTVKNFAKYATFAFGIMLLALTVIEIL